MLDDVIGFSVVGHRLEHAVDGNGGWWWLDDSPGEKAGGKVGRAKGEPKPCETGLTEPPGFAPSSQSTIRSLGCIGWDEIECWQQNMTNCREDERRSEARLKRQEC